jgi:hypothetical protein
VKPVNRALLDAIQAMELKDLLRNNHPITKKINKHSITIFVVDQTCLQRDEVTWSSIIYNWNNLLLSNILIFNCLYLANTSPKKMTTILLKE